VVVPLRFTLAAEVIVLTQHTMIVVLGTLSQPRGMLLQLRFAAGRCCCCYCCCYCCCRCRAMSCVLWQLVGVRSRCSCRCSYQVGRGRNCNPQRCPDKHNTILAPSPVNPALANHAEPLRQPSVDSCQTGLAKQTPAHIMLTRLLLCLCRSTLYATLPS
jgi:hypothetical protein